MPDVKYQVRFHGVHADGEHYEPAKLSAAKLMVEAGVTVDDAVNIAFGFGAFGSPIVVGGLDLEAALKWRERFKLAGSTTWITVAP